MNNKGLTIIEFLVAFIIAGIVAGIAIPSLKFIGDMHLKGCARSLVTDIRYTKDLVVQKGEVHKIIFENGGYKIVDQANNIIKEYKFTKDVVLSDNQLNIGAKKVNYMSYKPDGTASVSGSLTISKADGSKKMNISIVPVTGRALLTAQ